MENNYAMQNGFPMTKVQCIQTQTIDMQMTKTLILRSTQYITNPHGYPHCYYVIIIL